jgi:GntR family transcriptional regulator
LVQSTNETSKETFYLTPAALSFQLDFRSEETLTDQIVRHVREQIANGEMRHGDQLPTVRQLAEQLRVNFNTVARAYQELDEARLISTQRGRGTFVWEEPSPETIAVLREASLERLIERFVSSALALGFTPAEIEAAVQIVLHRAANQPAGGSAQA